MSLADSLRGYHVHIYYHDATEANAKDLHDQLVARFGYRATALMAGERHERMAGLADLREGVARP